MELNPAFGADTEIVNRLVAEIEHASKLRDPNILAPRGLYRSGNSLYVVSEAHSGVSLSTAFQILAVSGLRLSAEAVLRLAGAVLAALDSAATAASGREDSFYCHGFLTPESIFIADGQRVLVRGFGLWAGGIGRLKLLGPNEARYLTPSQNRAEAASPRADLFSLGTILFEAVAGVAAFDGPPDEEAVISLRDSVEELKGQGGASLQALYAVILACLTANNPIPTFRSRLRTTVDTLFLGELSHERVAKTLSLEELLGRVRPNRPAVIKAKSLALSRVEIAMEDRAPAGARANAAEPSSPPEFETVSMRPSPKPEEPPEVPALSSVSEGSGRWSSHKLWVLVVVAVLGGIIGAVILSSRPASRPEIARPLPRSLPSPLASVEPEAPAPLPPAAAVPATVEPEAVSLPTPDPPAPVRREEPPVSHAKLKEVRPRPVQGPLRRREPTTRPAPPAPVSNAAHDVGPSTAGPASNAVLPGSLVPLETAGLVRPVLDQTPEMLRFDSADARPSVERSVGLQILVDQRGRVRANRVLRADRIPPGFAQGVERYLATLRFQPAQLGGVPVRVWIPYELRFLAP